MKARSDLEPCIVHVDINSYFATLLQQENPALRGKPIGVVKGQGRTCVIASSNEAKKFGVKTGCMAKDARRLCPEIQFIPAQFDLCWDATKRLKALFESLTPTVEIFSLDEAFLHLTDCRRLYPDPHAFGRDIQQQIKEELGEWVRCNVGISYNRFLAKISSEMSPKGSVSEITQDNLVERLSTARFDEVCGIGWRLQQRLENMGVFNTFQINFLTDEELLKEFGPYLAVQLRKMGQGEEPDLLQRIDHLPHMKSVGRSITGYSLTYDEDTIRKVLYNLVEETTHKARLMKLAGRYVSIGLYGGGDEGKSWHRHQTFTQYLNRSEEMFEIIYHRLYKSWKRDFPVIKFSVRLGMLKPETEVLRPLWPQWHKRQALALSVDRITEKYGLFTVRPGTLTNGRLIRPEVTGFLGDKKFLFGR